MGKNQQVLSNFKKQLETLEYEKTKMENEHHSLSNQLDTQFNKVCELKTKLDEVTIAYNAEFSHNTNLKKQISMLESTAKVVEEIVIMAYPSGTEISDNVSAFEGKVSNFINANKTYITDAVAAPGSSGGALIAKKDGKVYGVLQGGYKEVLEVDINASFDIRNLFKQNDLVIEFN